MDHQRSMSLEEDSWTSVETHEAAHEIIPPASLALETKDMYYGEMIQSKAPVVYVSPQQLFQRGFLCLTTYRLLFVPHPKSATASLLDVPLCNIAEILLQDERANMSTISSVGYSLGINEYPKDVDNIKHHLEIACKNFYIVRFEVAPTFGLSSLYNRLLDALDGVHQIAPLAFASPDTHPLDSGVDVEALIERDMMRQGIVGAQDAGFFRLSRINQAFRVCPTYPTLFVVPRAVSDGDLQTIGHFRAKGRVPVITYRHADSNAVLARCAQPLVGLRRRRCARDELYIRLLQEQAQGRLYIIDCRHQTSAYGNVALGAGFEIAEFYNNVPLLFMNIENIHSMRDSIRRLFELVKGEVRGSERANWLSSLESTRWLEHVRSILVATTMGVDKMVDEGASLVVHCSDGWDRTAQIMSLIKVACDPYYRTLEGFALLVQHEWVAFGHRFESRCGLKPSSHVKKPVGYYWDDEQTSPVFVQFIDAIWQMTQQAPCSFEYLIAIVDEVYARRTGSFLYDCDEQRMKARVPARCPSLWARLEKLAAASGDLLNPFYLPPGTDNTKSPRVLRLKWHLSSLSIWAMFYLRSLEHLGPSLTDQTAWAKDVARHQVALKSQLCDATQELQRQVELNAALLSKVSLLESKTHVLHAALQGQVFSDRGVVVHEEVLPRLESAFEGSDEDDEGVLLSVTQTPIDLVVDEQRKPRREFIGGAITCPFEILPTYFHASS
ncbi:myotubularin-like protein [Achlya hypogyna]|uniref:Myotubularin-like protein n=1 Tax=Achlya hypogyna TaxID=1202772 RepID=A0A1V9Z8K3_ACHHY|nr:myotubularin-like protein [Achlya hypogyna]